MGSREKPQLLSRAAAGASGTPSAWQNRPNLSFCLPDVFIGALLLAHH